MQRAGVQDRECAVSRTFAVAHARVVQLCLRATPEVCGRRERVLVEQSCASLEGAEGDGISGSGSGSSSSASSSSSRAGRGR